MKRKRLGFGKNTSKHWYNLQKMIQKTEQEIVLTTGIYDLIKDHIRRKKASAEEEDVLLK